MKQLRYKSIRTRLTYWFLLLALIPLLMALVATYFQQVTIIEGQTFDKLTAIRDLKVKKLNEWIDTRLGDILIMSGDYEIRGLDKVFEQNLPTPENLVLSGNAEELLKRNLRNNPNYKELYIIDAATGLVEISTNPSRIKENKSFDDFFKNPVLTHEVHIHEIYQSNSLGEPIMIFSVPIFCMKHNENRVVGILVAHIDLNNSLYNILSDRVGLGKTGETLIVNKNALALNELRWFNNAPLNLQITAEPVIKATNGETGITVTTDYRGVDILAAYTYIPKTGWGFVCKQDLSELNAPIRRMVVSFILIFLISAIFIYLMAASLSRSISKPVVEMDEVAQKIRAGDFSVRNPVYSNNELGSLASEFNSMADVIESKLSIQEGIADISSIMIDKTTLSDFVISLLRQLMKITRASMSSFYILNEYSGDYEHFASEGANKEMLKPFNALNPEGEFGNVISQKHIYYLREIPEDTIYRYKTTAGDLLPREMITIPILVENSVVAIISLINIHQFKNECYEIILNSWQAINTSYSNLIAGERTRILAEHLSRINQQLEAQSEELQDQTEELQDQADELQRTSDELQQQNIELEIQKKQVEAANRLKSEFLSNMSHELRTPLNSILGLSRVLIDQAKNKLSEDENNFLEIVERNGKSLLSLINDILDLSKIEAGKMEVLPQEISINALLYNIKENLFSQAEKRGNLILIDCPDDLPLVETDEMKLHQVLTNIVSNAIKFTEKGKVNIKANFTNNKVFISVKDTGIGISKEVLPYIFDEFRQADGSSTREYEGTGLGLAIAKKMIQILGGNITVESEPGVGSEFTLTVPVKWHTNILKTAPTQGNLSGTFDGAKSSIKNTSDMRILLVEDNMDAIVQVKSVLENENFKVDIATGGQEALDYIKGTIPDGIILDLMMPGIDGFEVLEKMRSAESTKKIPVLVLTAKTLTKSELNKLSNNNIKQLIQKGDINVDGLISSVKQMLGNNFIFKHKVHESNFTKANDQDYPMHNEIQKRTTLTELPKILVVEDNQDNMITIKAILQDKYNIVEAVDGEQGLKMAKSLGADLILLDISLPIMSGKKIIKLLRSHKKTKQIPVIAVTAQAMIGDEAKFLDYGFDGYISKPIDHVVLLAEINRLLNR